MNRLLLCRNRYEKVQKEKKEHTVKEKEKCVGCEHSRSKGRKKKANVVRRKKTMPTPDPINSVSPTKPYLYITSRPSQSNILRMRLVPSRLLRMVVHVHQVTVQYCLEAPRTPDPTISLYPTDEQKNLRAPSKVCHFSTVLDRLSYQSA